MSTTHYELHNGQQRVIPGAGVYLQSQANAQSAYERAKAQLQATRAKRQITSGLGKDWSVDPNAQYGSYQQMLQAQGGELDARQDIAQQRGFFGKGLGNQGEASLRYGHAVANLGFKNQIADWEAEYANASGDLERQRQAEMLNALMGSAGDAFDDGDFTPWVPPAAVPFAGLGGTANVAGQIPRTSGSSGRKILPAAASFGGGLGAALIANRPPAKKKPQKTTSNNYAEARGYVR